MTKFDYKTMNRSKLNNRVKSIGNTLGTRLPVAINQVLQGAFHWLQNGGQGDTTALSALLTTLQRNKSREVKQVKIAIKQIAPYMTAKYNSSDESYTVGAKGWSKPENIVDVDSIRDYREYETPDSEKKEKKFNVDKRIDGFLTQAENCDLIQGSKEKLDVIRILTSDTLTPQRLAALHTIVSDIAMLDDVRILEPEEAEEEQAQAA